MAIPLHCSATAPATALSMRPSSSEVLRRDYGRVRASDKVVLSALILERAARFSNCPQPSSKRCKLSMADFSSHKSDEFQTDNSDGTRNKVEEPPEYWHTLIECLSDHQKSVSINFEKASILAYLWMLSLPSKALAETCESDNSLGNMPLLFTIAMIGATVGGLLARQRRGELKRLNEQLRQINAALRRQAKIESYAPNLSYAPIGSQTTESEVIVDPRKEQLMTYLRTGKNHLRNQAPEKAHPEFKAALELAKALGDHVEEKKAARGLGASLQRQGKYREAIKYHSMVLKISKRVDEDSGMTEAYGAIADCYTELGELEQAGKFYDEYIARLESD
ncbi:protein FLUORESCENT IN BLUE LIGHT, chloroplastic-like [Typha angustifolia]|uniref:protein FLUORESCENT IN BLUE LIGHT, chloroplastic-like n=1 Tax=Typha angustifolia TaxID=59011 RepID=UPI003C2EFB8F